MTEPLDPSAAANRDSKPTFPKRFYRSVGTAPHHDGVALVLDGRRARTPAKSPLVLPTQTLADAVAAEWAAVEAEIDPRRMPLTRFANSVIDGVSHNRADVLAEVLRYAASDLLVYRAEGPPDLVAAQDAAWNPIVAWSRERGAPLRLTAGVVFVAQPETTLSRLKADTVAAVGQGPGAAFRLAALHVVTTLTGSALLALAVAAKRLTAEGAWAAAHVDEDYQIARWGQDDEAAVRRAMRWIEMRTAGTLLEMAGSTP